MAQTATEVLTRMRTAHAASPRLVWHGNEGRVELSGRVFDNWASKTSNLLVDELDAGPGTLVRLDLPVHWKSLAIAFACWQVGCHVALGRQDAASAPDILFTARDVEPPPSPELLVCVELGSLAFRWTGRLPRGAVDYAAEVRSQGDVYLGAPQDGVVPSVVPSEVRSVVPPVAPADESGDAMPAPEVSDPASLLRASSITGPQDGTGAPTLLLEPGASLLHALSAAVAAWGQDGTLVLVEEGVEVAAGLLAGERVTSRLAPA